MMVNDGELSGWWLSPTPLKNDRVKVSWDDDIPNINGKIKFMFQTTNQIWNHLAISYNHMIPYE